DHVINHAGHLSYLSLGCLLEALTLAAGAAGLAASADLEAPGPSARTWARVHFAPGGAADDLAGELPHRATDRRLFHGGSPDDPVFDAIRADGSRSPRARVHLSPPAPELCRYIADADAYSWRHAACYRDFIRWVRFS